MTTIIGTRKGIYSDSQVTTGALPYLAEKIIIIDRTIIGCAGDCTAIEKFLTWYNDPDEDSTPEYDETEDFAALTLNANGLFFWCSAFGPDKVIGKSMCIGSGAMVAQTAMHLGKTPEQAIRVAAQLDVFSSLPIQTQLLHKGKKK
jgi:coenzyme F420-reducing hydrogenase gamma subunit